MSDEPVSSQPEQPPPRVRRSSFAGQTFADLFGTGRTIPPRENTETNNDTNNNGAASSATQQHPGPITTAAAQAQRRRMSLTTLGLGASPGQSSPFASFRGRTESFGSNNSGSIDESAVAEDDVASSPTNNAGSSPIARRTSFGARALRDIRRGSMNAVPTMGNGGGGGGLSPGQQQNGISSPPSAKRTNASNGTISSRDAKGRGEGFNWSDNFRTRAERTSSISGQGNQSAGGSPTSRMPAHIRAKSVAVMEPPINEMPKPRVVNRPDHFQERILKGDFYMD